MHIISEIFKQTKYNKTKGVLLRRTPFVYVFLTEIDFRNCNKTSEVLKSEYMELFKDGLSEGEGVGVGINFQQKIICDWCLLSAARILLP